MLNKIFEKWIEITETTPDCNVITNKNVDVYSYNERIKNLLKYNGEPMDAVILIDEFLTQYLKSRSVSLFDIYNKNKALEYKLASILEMKKLISSYNIDSHYEELIEVYKKALKAYEVDYSKTSDILKNRTDFIELKINALYAYESLKPRQFRRGVFSNEAPRFNKNIYAFYDVNVLLNAVMNNDEFNGITLNLIIDGDSFESSYFCFVIKNGDNVYLIGDIPEYSYPNQKYLRRTPGRQMEKRINLFNFPYELLNLEGSRYGLKSNTTELSIYKEYSVLGSISSCNPYSIIWIINMMAILKEKFFDNHLETNETYYTGAMIEREGIEQKEYGLSIVKNYDVLEMDNLSKEDTINCELTYSRESKKETAWIVDRYAGQVDDSILNMIGDSDRVELETETALSIPSRENLGVISENYSTIATREEFDYRQKWIARYNLAKGVDLLFEKEWKETSDEIHKWYENALRANSENILRAIAYGEFVSEEHDWQKLTEEGKAKYQRGENYNRMGLNGDIVTFGRELNVRNSNILTINLWEEDSLYITKGSTVLHQKDRRNLKCGWHYGCFVDGKKPVIYAKFKVTSARAIADLCGCAIEDLPELLRNYCKTRELFDGNYLLDNIDPMDWVIRNYVSEFDADVIVVLSKTSYNDLRKKYGLEPNKIWLEKK